jgi:hypothetical protein
VRLAQAIEEKLNTTPLFEAPTLAAEEARKSRAATPAAFCHYLVERRPDGSLWELGRGGMGVTYKALDVNLHCHVALKIIGPQCFGGENSRRRFIREARLAAQIRHPNVAAIYHLDSEGDEVFYAMEFVDGITAEEWIKGRGPMSPELALDVAMQVARALTAADCLKLVHRDIKPSNVMLLPDPADSARVIVKVIDFGLARSLEMEVTSTVTTCAFVGTPQFASPEQVENLELDIRSDIYSLGCMLWYLIAGEAPFTGSAARVMAQQLTGEPPFEKLTTTPGSVKTLLGSMLAKSAEARPQNPVALHNAICRCREELGRPAPTRAGLLVTAQARLAEVWARRSTSHTLSWAASLGIFALIAFLLLPATEEVDAAAPLAGEAHIVAVAAAAPTTVPTTAPAAKQSAEEIPGLPLEFEHLQLINDELAAEGTASKPSASMQLTGFSAAGEPGMWMTSTTLDSTGVVDLSEPHTVGLSLIGLEARDPAEKRTVRAATGNGNGKRKSGTAERRSSASNPLHRARRNIQNFVNRIF